MKRIIIALVTLWSTWALADFKVTDPIFAPPNWTTATRPVCPVSYGCIGFNTDLDKIEIWNGTEWSAAGSMLGPVTSTPNTVALYADDTGKLLGATAYTIPVDAGNVGDVLRIASAGGATTILSGTDGYADTFDQGALTGQPGQFDSVLVGDDVEITGGTNAILGDYKVMAVAAGQMLSLDRVFITGGSSSDIAYTITRAGGAASAEWQAISSSKLQDADGNTSIDVDITDDGAADVIVFANNSSETARFTADGRMGIGTDTPNPNAILDLSSTTKAFLLPRLNNAEMVGIPSPLNGMQVFNTDNKKVYFYNGSGWEATGVASTLFNLGITDAVATPTIPPDPTPPAAGYKNGDFYIVSGFGNVAAVFNPSVTTAGTGDYLIFDHGADGAVGGGDDTWEKIAFSDVGQISRNGNTTDLHLMIWDQDNTNSAKDTGISSLDLMLMSLNAPGPDFAVVSAGAGDKTMKLAPYTLPMVVGADGDILVSDGAGTSAWTPIGDIVPAAIVVEDNLTSTSAVNALSANQGRVLNEDKVSGPAVSGATVIINGLEGTLFNPPGLDVLEDAAGFVGVQVGDTIIIPSGQMAIEGEYTVAELNFGGNPNQIRADRAMNSASGGGIDYTITRGGGGGVVADTVALFDGTTGRLIKATPYKIPLAACAEGEILQADANGDFLCAPITASRIHDADDNTFVDVEATGDINRISFGVEGIPNPMVIDSNGNVGIGTLDPDPNAILDLSSTTKAFLMPRLTVAQIQAIAAPVEGMQVMNIDSGKLVFYNGAAWEPAGVSSGMINLGIVEANPYVAPTPPAEGYKQGEFYVVDGVGTLGMPFDDPVATGPDVATASTGDWLVFDDGGTSADTSDDGWNRVAFSDTGALTRGGNTLDNQIMFWDGDNNNVAKAIDGFLSANPGQLQLGSATSGTSGALILTTNAALQNIILRAPDVASANYVITLPTEVPEEGQFLQTDVNGQLSWISVTGLAGDVVGPDTSTPNTMAMFANDTGKLLKESGYTVPATAGNLGDVLTISSAGGGAETIILPSPNTSMGSDTSRNMIIQQSLPDYSTVQVGDTVRITAGTNATLGDYTVVSVEPTFDVMTLDRNYFTGTGTVMDVIFSVVRGGGGGTAVATWEPAAITVVVEDSLISTSTDNALSANMGRVLNEKKVEGPATSVGDTFAMFDGTTGKFIKESSYKLPLAVCADGETLTSDGTNFLCTPVSVMSKTIYNANGFGGSATTNLSSFYFTNIRTPTNSDCYTVTNSPTEGFYITVNKACVFNISYSSSNIGGLLDSGFVLNPDANDLAGEFEQIAFSKKLCNTAVQGVTGSTGSCSFQWDGTIGEKIYLLGSASMTPDTPEKFAVSIMGFLPGSEIGVGVQAAAPTMVEVIPQRTDGEAGNGFPNLLTNPSGGAGTRGIFEGVVEVGDKVTITSGTSVTPGVYSVTAVEPDRVTVSGNFYIGSGLSQDVVYSVSRAIPSGQAGGTGDVVGPASSTLNSLAIYSDATGKLIGSKSGITFNDTSFADLTLGSNVIPYKLGRIALTDSNNNFLILRPAYGGASQTLTFPSAAPAANQILQSDATGQLSWIDTPTGGTGGGGTGDVVGPASVEDNFVPLFDGTTGKLIKQSGVAIMGGELVIPGTGNNIYMGLGVSGGYSRAGVLRFYTGVGDQWNGWGSLDVSIPASYSAALPAAQGTVGQTLVVNNVGTGSNGEPQMNLGWAAAGGGGSGDVVGPASTVDNTVALFSGTTGKTLKTGSMTYNPSVGYLDLNGTNSQITVHEGVNREIIYAADRIEMKSPGNANRLFIMPASTMSATYYMMMPAAGPSGTNKILSALSDLGGGTWQMGWTSPPTAGLGDVVGPAASTDNQLAVFSGTTGKTMKAPPGGMTYHLTTTSAGGLTIQDFLDLKVNSSSSYAYFNPSASRLTMGGNSGAGSIRMGYGPTFYAGFKVGSGLTSSYDLTMPNVAPAANQILQSDAAGILSWINTPGGGAAGDVFGPASSVATAIPYFSSTTGKVLAGANGIQAVDSATLSLGEEGTRWGKLRFNDINSGFNLDISTGGLTQNLLWHLPLSFPQAGQALTVTSVSNPDIYFGWASGGAGDVIGPASSAVDQLPVFSSTTGKVLKTATGASIISTGAMLLSGSSAAMIIQKNGSGNVKGQYESDKVKYITANGAYDFSLIMPPALVTTYGLTFPNAPPAANQILQSNATGQLSWINTPGGSGDVVGPASASDGDVAFFTSAKVIKSTQGALGKVNFDTTGRLRLRGDTPNVLVEFPTGDSSRLTAYQLDFSASGGANMLSLVRSPSQSATYALTFPTVGPTAGQSLQADATGQLSWVTAGGGGGSGDVVGPASSADNAFALYDGTTGKLLKGYGMLKFQVEDAGLTIVQTFDGSMGGQRGGLKLIDDSGDVLRILQNHNQTASYDISFPTTAPAANTMLESDATGQLSWIATPASDARLKTKIAPMERDFLADIMALTPSTFEWTEKTRPTGTQRGLIAQDVMKVIPEAVYAKTGGTLDLNDRALIATLIGAVKQQQVQIEELKLELSKLKK